MKKFIISFVDSVWAGIMIAVASSIYLLCPDKIIGAFLFSIGLITIIQFGYNLYTGKIGYAKIKDIPTMAIILIGNFIGCWIISFLSTDASEMYAAKIACSLPSAFIKGIICGFLIFIAVHAAKSYTGAGKYIFTIFAIPSFILCKAEHCIADICYMISAKNFTLDSVLFILMVVIGNSVGSILMNLWIKYKDTLRSKNGST